MARPINSFEQFVSANEDLRKYYENARSKHRESIDETLRMIQLSQPLTEQTAYDDYVENKTNAKIGNTWEYKPEETKPEVKNKINHNITDL
jgi:hypothetical protein